MSSILARIKTEPALLVGLAQAVLGLLVVTGVVIFTEDQTGTVLGIVSAVLSLILGLSVRPFSWPLVTGVVQAGIMLLLAFGVNISSTTQASIYAVLAALVAIVNRQNVTPETKLSPVPLRG
ncbi:MAG: hypothetical protein ACRD0W_00515 [Acidimicrobiales bacterium]